MSTHIPSNNLPLSTTVTQITIKENSKIYLCPKCGNSYEFLARNRTLIGRVPLILNCNHTICEECIGQAVKSTGQVVCADCQEVSVVDKQDYPKLQMMFSINFYLLGIIYYTRLHAYENVNKILLQPAGVTYSNRSRKFKQQILESVLKEILGEKCLRDGCNKNVSIYCADCNKMYCNVCSQVIHKLSQQLQNHKVTQLTINSFQELVSKCDVHKESILEFYCNTCETNLCCYCILNSHSNHSFNQLTKLTDSDRTNMETLIEKSEEKLKHLLMTHKKVKEQLNQIKSTSSSKTEGMVGKYFANIHATLQRVETNLYDDEDKIKNNNIVVLNNIDSKIIDDIRLLYNLVGIAKNIINPNSNTKINVKNVIEKLEHSMDLPCYLIGEEQSHNIKIPTTELFNNLEDNFTVTCGDSNNFQLVGKNDIPEDYDASLSEDVASLTISEFTISSQDSDDCLSLHSKSSYTSEDINSQNYNTVQKFIEDSSKAMVKETNVSLLKLEYQKIIVTHIDTPECFYVQLLQSRNDLQKLSRSIKQYIDSSPPFIETPELNKLYIVNYKAPNIPSQWYRGRLLEIITKESDQTYYKILFIDYGNTTFVNIDMLREITPNLAKPQHFALQCKLYQTFPIKDKWDDKAMKLMAQIITGTSVSMVVLNNSCGILEVDLLPIHNGEQMSIRNSLFFTGYAMVHLDAGIPKTMFEKKMLKNKAKLYGNKRIFKANESIEVVLSHVIDPDCIYVQIADRVCHIIHLSDVMYTYYNNRQKYQGTEDIYLPVKDTPVAAYVQEINGTTWYRGIIKDVISGQGKVDVFLVDIGKTVTVLYTHVKYLLGKFCDLECQAIPLKLAHIKPKDDETIWNKNCSDLLNKYVTVKSTLRLLVVEVKQPICGVLFERQQSMEICINALLVKNGHAEATGEFGKEVEYLTDNLGTAQTSLLNALHDSTQDDIHLSYDSDKDDDVIRKPIEVLESKNPDLIYFKFLDPILMKHLETMIATLQEFYSTNRKKTKTNWDINDFCVVYDSKKNEYSRGLILEKVDESHFKVMLRDILQEIVIPEENIFILEDNFKTYPPRLQRGHLAGIIPAGDSKKWSGLAVEFLQDIFENNSNIFMTKEGSVDKERKSIPVIMWYSKVKPGGALEPSKLSIYNINKLLIRKGLALKVELGLNKIDDSTSDNENKLAEKSTLNDTTFLVESSKSPLSEEQPDDVQTVEKILIADCKSPTHASSCNTECTAQLHSKVKKNIESAKKRSRKKSKKATSPVLDIKNTVTAIPVNKNNSTDWNELISEEELKKASSITSPPKDFCNWIPPQPFKFTEFYAYATFVDEDACIYLHDVEFEPVLRGIEAEMKSVFHKTQSEPEGTIWAEGQICTVRYFLNDSWYRGKIVKVTDDHIKVFMIDYGNTEDCKHEDLRFKIMYSNIPAFANKVRLLNVHSKTGKQWLTSDLDELHKTIVDKRLFVTLSEVVAEDGVGYAIIKLHGGSINSYMIENCSNLVAHEEVIKKPPYKEYRKELNDSDMDIIIEAAIEADEESDINFDSLDRFETNDKFIYIPLPDSFIGQKINATISTIISYNECVIEIIDTVGMNETVNVFGKIHDDIKNRAMERPILRNLRIGQACIAQFSKDNEWYRGEVSSINPINKGVVEIWFVDFGNYENVSLDCIRSIDHEWLKMPVFQYKAKLHDIGLMDPSYLDIVMEIMEEFCNSSKLIEIVTTDPLVIKLYDNYDENVLAYQDLIDKQLLYIIN